MAAAAGEPSGRRSDGRGGRVERLDQPLVEGDRFGPVDPFQFEVEPPACHDRLEGGDDLVLDPFPVRPVGAPDVDRERHLATDLVDGALDGGDVADRGDQVAVGGGLGGDRFDPGDHLAGGGQRVLPEVHRRRPRVVVRPPDRRPVPDRGPDARDDAYPIARLVEHPALFDVEFEERGHAVEVERRLGEVRRSEPRTLHRQPQRHVVPVGGREGLDGQHAERAAAPDRVLAEAGGLLATEDRQGRRVRRRPVARVDGLDRLQRRDDTECPVEPPAVVHRVEVATEVDGSIGVGSTGRVEVPDRVLPGRVRVGQLRPQIAERLVLGLGVGQARHAPAVGTADRPEVVQAPADPIEVDVERVGGHAKTSHISVTGQKRCHGYDGPRGRRSGGTNVLSAADRMVRRWIPTPTPTPTPIPDPAPPG